MSEKYLDIITILLLTAVPLLFLLLHTFLSTRKSIVWSFLIPVFWTALGGWMIIAGHDDFGFNSELFVFYLIGDVILAGITIVIKKYNRKRK